MDGMHRRIAELIAASGADAVAVVYRDLETDAELLIEPDLAFHPASTFKIGVLCEAYRQASAGARRIDDPVPIVNSFRSVADGSEFAMRPEDDSETSLYGRIGGMATVRELVDLMITRSSNLATSILIAELGAAAVTGFMAELGAPGLVVLRGPEDNVAYGRGLNNAATARALAEVFVRLARGDVVSPAASAEMLTLLRGQTFNEGIPAGLPPGTPVAHKTGWNDHLYHDAALVYAGEVPAFVLVVMTRGLPEETAGPALVRAISAATFAFHVAPAGPDT